VCLSCEIREKLIQRATACHSYSYKFEASYCENQIDFSLFV
jgi:hypothetical protein